MLLLSKDNLQIALLEQIAEKLYNYIYILYILFPVLETILSYSSYSQNSSCLSKLSKVFTSVMVEWEVE